MSDHVYRIIPEGSRRPSPTVWTTIEALDRARESWKKILNDDTQPTSLTLAASRLLNGETQIGEITRWAHSDD